MLRLGLTGGIGSGKSTVAAMLAAHGAAIIDADAISRRATAVGGMAMPAIRQHFGGEFITLEGSLDRSRMRELVFSDPTARRRLEQIIHPLVAQEALHQSHVAAQTGSRCVVLDIPLLVESGHWRARLDKVLVIDCSRQTQLSRVMARDGLAREQIERILDNQASREARLRSADVVLCNEGGSIGELSDLVRSFTQSFGL